jgi:hypothetical protein
MDFEICILPSFGAEAFNVFNQRLRTIYTVGPTHSGFANVSSANFNNYSLGGRAGSHDSDQG